ncbi:hypothetical protein EU511_08235 [Pseudoalteromonas distincta]|nr:hypothetical protein EU511_08235 [Pseudoalteromonas distincta]
MDAYILFYLLDLKYLLSITHKLQVAISFGFNQQAKAIYAPSNALAGTQFNSSNNSYNTRGEVFPIAKAGKV